MLMHAKLEAVLFFHIPKTCGSSILDELYAVEGDSAVFGIEDTEDANVAGRVFRLLRRDSELRVIHGHFSPAKFVGMRDVYRAVLLRDPLERLQSHFCYNFQYRFAHREDYRFFRQPQYAGKRQFDLECLSQWVSLKRADNYQTRFLAGDFENPVDDGMLQRAQAVLHDMHIVGTSCALPAFLDQLAHMLGTDPLTLRHSNPSDRKVLHLSEADRQVIADRYLQFDQALFQTAIGLSRRQHRHLPIVRKRSVAVPQPRTRLDAMLRNKTMPELVRRARRRLFSSWRLAREKARGCA